jgi:hypothetical protein
VKQETPSIMPGGKTEGASVHLNKLQQQLNVNAPAQGPERATAFVAKV